MNEHHAWGQFKLESPFFYITEYEIGCSMCWHKGPESEFISYSGTMVRTQTGFAPTIESIGCPSCGAIEATSLGIRIQNFLYAMGRLFDGQKDRAETQADIHKSPIS